MLHISARSALYALDVPESSGAMNSGVPTSVMLPADRAASPTLSASLPRPSDVVENPRSHSLTLPSSPSRMFSSLMSLPEKFADMAMKARHLFKLLVVDSLHTFDSSLSLSTLKAFPVWIFFQQVFTQHSKKSGRFTLSDDFYQWLLGCRFYGQYLDQPCPTRGPV